MLHHSRYSTASHLLPRSATLGYPSCMCSEIRAMTHVIAQANPNARPPNGRPRMLQRRKCRLNITIGPCMNAWTPRQRQRDLARLAHTKTHGERARLAMHMFTRKRTSSIRTSAACLLRVAVAAARSLSRKSSGACTGPSIRCASRERSSRSGRLGCTLRASHVIDLIDDRLVVRRRKPNLYNMAV